MKDKTNCPNCGAPIKHYYNHNCEYCGTFLHNTDNEVEMLNDKEIKIKSVEVRNDYARRSYFVYIRGITETKGNWWAEGCNQVMAVVDNQFKDNRINFGIEIPMEYVERASFLQNDMNFLINYLKRNIPPPLKQWQNYIIHEILIKTRR